MWIHQTSWNYKAACFAPSLWHVSATRGFWGCPSIGKSCSQFFRLKHHVSARAAIVAKNQYYRRKLPFFVKCWILPSGIGGIGGQPLVQGSFRQRALRASPQIVQFRIWLWTCVMQDSQISQMHLYSKELLILPGKWPCRGGKWHRFAMPRQYINIETYYILYIVLF